MERYFTNDVNPNIRYINKSVEMLTAGGVIIYPTDTSYGVGCSINSFAGVKRLNNLAIKQERSLMHTILCRNFSEISEYAQIDNHTFRFLKKYLPGRFTFVLNATAKVPKVCLTKRKTIGIRISENNVVKMLLDTLGNPLLNFSALSYDSTRINDNPEDIFLKYYYEIDSFIDIGEVPTIITSVIDLTNDSPEVIRQGAGIIDF